MVRFRRPRDAQDRCIHGKREQAARPQLASCFRDRAKGIGKAHCSVIAKNDIERIAAESRRFGISMNQRKVHPSGLHERTRMLELARRIIQRRHLCAEPVKGHGPLRAPHPNSRTSRSATRPTRATATREFATRPTPRRRRPPIEDHVSVDTLPPAGPRIHDFARRIPNRPSSDANTR